MPNAAKTTFPNGALVALFVSCLLSVFPTSFVIEPGTFESESFANLSALELNFAIGPISVLAEGNKHNGKSKKHKKKELYNPGRVSSRPCPHSCQSLGLSKSVCKDWREGSLCYVENLTKAPRVIRKHGFVTTRPCPYSCQSAGLSKQACRDWKQGNQCFVEDLTRKPGSAATPVAGRPGKPKSPASTATPMPTPTVPDAEDGDDANAEGARACRALKRRISDPRIEISRIRRTGNFLRPDYRVEGVIEGVCLSEAGYFEKTRKKQDISVVTSPDFRRFEFSIKVRVNEDPEVRAYNIFGARDIEVIDPYENNDRQGPTNNSGNLGSLPAKQPSNQTTTTQRPGRIWP
jgi:hypothetical protein